MMVFDLINFVIHIFSMLHFLTIVHDHDLMGQLNICYYFVELLVDYSYFWLLASLVVSVHALEKKKNDIQLFCRDKMEPILPYLTVQGSFCIGVYLTNLNQNKELIKINFSYTTRLIKMRCPV